MNTDRAMPLLARVAAATVAVLASAQSPAAPPLGLVGGCTAPNITAVVEVALARDAPWKGGVARTLHGRLLHVAKAAVARTPDVRKLQLEEREGGRVVVLELSPEAARRLEAETKANVGGSMVVVVNDTSLVANIMGPIPGPKLVVSTPGARLNALCKTP